MQERNKTNFIARYGEDAYRDLKARNLKSTRKYQLANPEKVKVSSYIWSRKGGKGYSKHLKYNLTGLQGERNKIRQRHRDKWQRYKKIIAPDSQIHHQWQVGSAEYDGVALVEKDQHRHGIIDVIEILDGEIRLLSEEDIKNRDITNKENIGGLIRHE